MSKPRAIISLLFFGGWLVAVLLATAVVAEDTSARVANTIAKFGHSIHCAKIHAAGECDNGSCIDILLLGLCSPDHLHSILDDKHVHTISVTRQDEHGALVDNV